MDRVWEIGKKAGLVAVFLVSLPVLVPCVLVLTFTGALLAVPVGSAAAGFLLLKKVVNARKQLTWYGPEETSAPPASEASEVDGSGELPSSYNVSMEEAPELSYYAEPSKASDDFIVVEKPSERQVDEGTGDMGQCKAAPDYFQCVEAEGEEVVCHDKHVEEEKGTKDDKGSKPVEAFVEVTQDGKTQHAENGGGEAQAQGESDVKNQGVGLSVILEESADKSTGEEKKLPDHPEEAKKDEHPSVEGARENEGEQESSGEYVSMTEDFPSSDESIASSKTAPTKGEISDKEKRTRLRKEIVVVKRVVGCTDATGGPLAEQVEKLYSFVGVELPSGYRRTNDLGKLMEALNLLKAIVGVK